MLHLEVPNHVNSNFKTCQAHGLFCLLEKSPDYFDNYETSTSSAISRNNYPHSIILLLKLFLSSSFAPLNVYFWISFVDFESFRPMSFLFLSKKCQNLKKTLKTVCSYDLPLMITVQLESPKKRLVGY